MKITKGQGSSLWQERAGAGLPARTTARRRRLRDVIRLKGDRRRFQGADPATAYGSLSKKAVFLSRRAVNMSEKDLIGYMVCMKDKDGPAIFQQLKIRKAGVGGAGHGHRGKGRQSLSFRAVTVP